MKLVTRADLARLAGVSKAAITQACRIKLKAACHEDLVDADHEAARAYLRAHAKRQPKATAKPKAASAKRTQRTPQNPRGAGRRRKLEPPDGSRDAPAPKLDDWGFCDAIKNLTAGEISKRFGSNRAYAIWLEAYERQQRADQLFTKNQQLKGSLVSRELVETHVFGALRTLHKRLLTDSAKTLTGRIFALAKSGSSQQEAEAILRDLIGKQLRQVTSSATRVLRGIGAEQPDVVSDDS